GSARRQPANNSRRGASRRGPERPGSGPPRAGDRGRAARVSPGRSREATMGREAEKAARSVEEAVDAALQELGVSEQQAVIEVLQEPGMGQDAVVRVRAVGEELDMEALEDQADAVADFLEELLARMEIDAVAEPEIHGEHMYVDVVGDDEDDLALLIGRH